MKELLTDTTADGLDAGRRAPAGITPRLIHGTGAAGTAPLVRTSRRVVAPSVVVFLWLTGTWKQMHFF